MTGVFIKFFISLVVLWLVLMYNVWKEQVPEENIDNDLAKKSYNKLTRLMRKLWFALLRFWLKIRKIFADIFQKIFFIIFPNARKAFEKKDEMTGLNHGPSSYFLKTITPEKGELNTEVKKNRRKPKNV